MACPQTRLNLFSSRISLVHFIDYSSLLFLDITGTVSFSENVVIESAFRDLHRLAQLADAVSLELGIKTGHNLQPLLPWDVLDNSRQPNDLKQVWQSGAFFLKRLMVSQRIPLCVRTNFPQPAVQGALGNIVLQAKIMDRRTISVRYSNLLLKLFRILLRHDTILLLICVYCIIFCGHQAHVSK